MPTNSEPGGASPRPIDQNRDRHGAGQSEPHGPSPRTRSSRRDSRTWPTVFNGGSPTPPKSPPLPTSRPRREGRPQAGTQWFRRGPGRGARGEGHEATLQPDPRHPRPLRPGRRPQTRRQAGLSRKARPQRSTPSPHPEARWAARRVRTEALPTRQWHPRGPITRGATARAQSPTERPRGASLRPKRPGRGARG